ncbi:Putative HVA22-like protein g [Apostasia shenzhenica]|uniref:HVA22-like protein g n=1 Tax=Apostasia shenzhenica TaxID=1088818 RepID=A0A2I0AL68_9ASPA|nr:Putative HVA22-like protein g [Apostasia shenzhenica]
MEWSFPPIAFSPLKARCHRSVSRCLSFSLPPLPHAIAAPFGHRCRPLWPSLPLLIVVVAARAITVDAGYVEPSLWPPSVDRDFNFSNPARRGHFIFSVGRCGKAASNRSPLLTVDASLLRIYNKIRERTRHLLHYSYTIIEEIPLISNLLCLPWIEVLPRQEKHEIAGHSCNTDCLRKVLRGSHLVGTRWVYEAFLRPWVSQHEPDIELKLQSYRARASELLLFYIKNFTEQGKSLFLEMLHYITADTNKSKSKKSRRSGSSDPDELPPIRRQEGRMEDFSYSPEMEEAMRAARGNHRRSRPNR